MKITKLSLIFIFLSAVFSYSENIRGPVINIIDSATLSSSEITAEFDLSPEELFAILPDFNNLPDKISIEIRSSEKIKQFRDSFSLYSYTNVSPAPSLDNKSYTGNYKDSSLIPDRTRFFIDIILNKNISSSRPVKGTEILDFSNIKISKPFLFTILPVMKGVPDYLFSEKFRIKIKTYWPEQGKLSLKVFKTEPDSSEKTEIQDYNLIIDGSSFDNKNIVLNTGIHSLSVKKEGYIEHKENISVKTNETRHLDITLLKNNPVLTVFSPDESVLYIDGNIQNSKKISTLNPGEHTIVFKLGDYSLSRTIDLDEGKNYIVNLLLDIEIKEE